MGTSTYLGTRTLSLHFEDCEGLALSSSSTPLLSLVIFFISASFLSLLHEDFSGLFVGGGSPSHNYEAVLSICARL